MPRRQDVGILNGTVAEVVLGMDAHHRGLDAKVDVLGHEHHTRLGVQRLQGERGGEDGVVVTVTGQILGQGDVQLLCLEKQAS